MGLLKQFLVVTVLVIGVSSSTTEQPSKTTVTSTHPPVPSSTAKPPAEVKKPEDDSVVPSASIGNAETPAVVEEVPHDWTDGVVPPDGDYTEEADANNTDEYVGSYHEYSDYPEDYYYDEGYAYKDYELHAADENEAPTQEGFQENVPESLHDDMDIIINRDNVVPITRTLILAVTGKENPTYAELLKAGGITAFKTSLKHLGDEKMGVNLLALAKKLTNMWDDSEESKGDEEEDENMLRKMAEDFLASHRFKLVLPESILLHEAELKELLAKRVEESEVEGRSAPTEESQLTIFTPRAEPGVTTLLSMSPVPWIALFTGLLSIPYFMSDDTPSPVARVDRPGRLPQQALPFRQLRPPGLPFVRNQQLRRDETNVPRQNQPFDQEFLEYKKKYAQWYNQWYLKHKEYYDKNFPFNTQAQGQIRPPPAGPAQRPPLRPANGPPPNPRPPPQRRRKPVQGQNPNRPPPQSRVPAKRRRVRPVRPIPPAAGIPRPALPQGQGARNAAQSSSISAIAEPHPNDFGTFPKEDNHGDSHFRVFRGPDVSTSTTTAPPTPKVVPKVPSPQPVYIPTTKAPPTTETGFKPIIKPDAPVADNTGVVRSQTVSESVQTPKQVKPNFRPPKQDDLLEKTKPVAVPKKPGTPPTNVQLAPGGFKPIPGLANVSPPRIEPETSTRKVSVITSSIFKTAPTTQTPPKTPAAVFFRTATEKSVRVVTSSSFVTQPTVPLPQKQALKDIRPQRHQESQSLDVSASLQAEESRPTVVIEAVPAGPQFLRSREEAPAGAPEPSVRSRGAVRTNVPAHIRVVDHLDHRPPQGFGLGPKPGDESEPLVSATTTPTATTPAPSPSTPTTVPIFALDSFYGSRLSRIDVIFHQLKVEGEGCREQVVCNIYKNPEVYTPFSDFLSRQLTVTLEELRRPKVSDERILRFFRYLKAARDGQDGVDCLARYPKCGQDTTSLSHKPIITTYQKVSRLMDASSSS